MPRGLAALSAVTALIALATTALARENPMQVKTIESVSTVEDELFPIVLTIDGSGRATLTLATNARHPADRAGGCSREWFP